MPPSLRPVLLAALALLLASGTVASADPAPWEHQERSSTGLRGAVRKVVVDLDAGAVTLQQGRLPRVSSTSTWFMTKPSLSVSVRDGVLTVTGRCPDFVKAPALSVGDPLGSCRTDVSVTLAAVPAGVAVSTRAGDVTVTGVRGPVALTSGYGDVKARRLRGPVRVTAEYGDADLTDVVASGLQVSSTNGDAGLTRVRSSRTVLVRSALGRVSGAAIVAPVMQVTSSAGSAQLIDVRVGALTMRADGGTAVLNDSVVKTAEVSTTTEDALVSGLTARSRLTVRTDSGVARLTELRTPRLEAEASSGGVDLASSRVGGARLRADGLVVVRGVAFGALAVDGGTGGVGVSTRHPFSSLSVTTSNGDVDVTVPSGAYVLLVRSDTGQTSVAGVTADPRASRRLSVSSATGSLVVHGR